MSGIGKANLRGAAAKTDKRPLLLLLLVRSKVILEFNFIQLAFLAVASLRLKGSAETDSQTVNSDLPCLHWKGLQTHGIIDNV